MNIELRTTLYNLLQRVDEIQQSLPESERNTWRDLNIIHLILRRAIDDDYIRRVELLCTYGTKTKNGTHNAFPKGFVVEERDESFAIFTTFGIDEEGRTIPNEDEYSISSEKFDEILTSTLL